MIALADISHYLLLFTLVLALVGVITSCYHVLYKKETSSIGVESINLAISFIYIFVSAVLFYAFYSCEFSYKYVHDYSDSTLPIFYRLTAFWGGQAGSLLFWALSVVLCGVVFQYSKLYKKLSPKTRCWYLLFYFVNMGFLSLLLTTQNDPFVLLNPIPLEGRGLNPLLQHPGMIFHPPLLLLGYAGFTIPACLALAQAMSLSAEDRGSEIPWYACTQNIMVSAWLLLSAGIILGAWWAYMELGWGGYWAWDPVENASLIPWFFATAAIHLGFINAYRKKGERIHVLVMGLTYVSAFLATWLVRGNVVASVHAFGGGVGGTIGGYVIFTTFAVFGICACMPKVKRPFAGPETKEGLSLATALLLITISLIILLATLWPVISTLPAKWFGMGSAASVGLNADFYNKTIMPLLTVVVAILTLCPWISWAGHVKHKLYLGVVALVFVVSMGASWTFFGITKPMALMGVSISVACMASWLLYTYVLKFAKLSAALVHLGFAMMGLGVAVSGPYNIEQELTLSRAESITIDDFEVKLNEVYQVPAYSQGLFTFKKGDKSDLLTLKLTQSIKVSGYTITVLEFVDNRTVAHGRDVDLQVTYPDGSDHYVQLTEGKPFEIADFSITLDDMKLNRISFVEAELFVYKDGKQIGSLLPQIRRYATHPTSRYSEAVTIFSLGKEIYATFSGIDAEQKVHVRILIQPMVNWIWIGGTLMSIAPFIGIFSLMRRRKEEDMEEDADA